jgi:hypothetical protein
MGTEQNMASTLRIEAARNAKETACRLHNALRAVGFEAVDFATMWGGTNMYGEPVVTLGRFTAEVADRLADILTGRRHHHDV